MGSPKGEKSYYQTIVQEYYSRSSSSRFFTTCVAFHAVSTASFRKCRFKKHHVKNQNRHPTLWKIPKELVFGDFPLRVTIFHIRK